MQMKWFEEKKTGDLFFEFKDLEKNPVWIYTAIQQLNTRNYFFVDKRVFLLRFNASTEKVTGIYFNNWNDYEIRRLSPEEMDFFKTKIKGFRLKKTFAEQEGYSLFLNEIYKEAERSASSLDEMLKVGREFLKAAITIEDKRILVDEMEKTLQNQRLPRQLINHIMSLIFKEEPS